LSRGAGELHITCGVHQGQMLMGMGDCGGSMVPTGGMA